MKKVSCIVATAIIFCLAGCFETTQELTINSNGSGLLSHTIDLSNLVALLQQMAGDDAKKLSNTDTTISLAGISDSLKGLTAAQSKIVDQGNMRLTLNMQDEKLAIRLNLPFQRTADLKMLEDALPQVAEAVLRKLPGSEQIPTTSGPGDSSRLQGFDNFFDLAVTGKGMSKSLNRARYDGAKNGDFMKSLQQMSQMGSPIKASYIIHLPRPAKAASGKALKLSEDKKTVTLDLTGDDFFDDPSKFEYHIEY